MKTENLQSNPELELAYEYVCHTSRNIFLTGKAGTGKTTFLHRIREEKPKRMAVVAPTGVAAINASGMTIHSLFQIPFGPFFPDGSRRNEQPRRFSRKKINLIRSLDLLVIDEISMVRADLLDSIDDTLRRYKNAYQPFGGVQLLLIGDLHQLPPVVKDHEWNLLRPYYDTPYFFSSQALQKTKPVTVQLQKIYRQSDDTFIRLLNKVRHNEVDLEVLSTLNGRYRPPAEIPQEEAYITLSTHNATADKINREQLDALAGKKYTFKAQIERDFPAHAYPTDELLHLKEGAQVMFVKNDISPEKLYYNGKIGEITRIADGAVTVQCPDDDHSITVVPAEWHNRKYHLNDQTKEVTEEIVGTFTQYPLRLAWAITIHKSQGLTFDRVILDAQSAFAHGQVYVALSRCKSFEGIVLRSKIEQRSVRTDNQVQEFSKKNAENPPSEAELLAAKAAFQQTALLDLFGFDVLRRQLQRLNRLILEEEHRLLPGALSSFRSLSTLAKSKLFPVEQKFRQQILAYCQQLGPPEANEGLQERVKKAARWFEPFVGEQLWPAAEALVVSSDNKKVNKSASQSLEALRTSIYAKRSCLGLAQAGFSAARHLRQKVDAELDYQQQQAPATKRSKSAPAVETQHPALYARLYAWRKAKSEADGVPAYSIAPTKTLIGIANVLPTEQRLLKEVYGVGPNRLKAYGAEWLDMVQGYCDEYEVKPGTPDLLNQVNKANKPSPKPNTRSVTFDLFESGKSIEEIAEVRGLTEGTVTGHLAHYVKVGWVPISQFMEQEVAETIGGFLSELEVRSLGAAKAHFGDQYSYGQLHMAAAHLDWQEKQKKQEE